MLVTCCIQLYKMEVLLYPNEHTDDCQNSNYLYPPAGHVITGYLNVIPGSRVRYTIPKGPKYRIPSNIYFPKCRREIAAFLNDFSNH